MSEDRLATTGWFYPKKCHLCGAMLGEDSVLAYKNEFPELDGYGKLVAYCSQEHATAKLVAEELSA